MSRLLSLFGVVALVWLALPAASQSLGDCDLNPNLVFCDVGGGGGGGSTTSTTIAEAYYWWARGSAGECDDGDPRYIRYLHWADGSYVLPMELTNPPNGSILGTDRIYQLTCASIPAPEVWNVLETASEALPPPAWEASPPGQGVTGFESWMWFSGQTQLGPVVLSWTDPVTGISFDLQGRAWVGDITWTTGDGEDPTVYALSYVAGADVGGTSDDPATTHFYEVTSSDSGFDAGYPVQIEITWVGEWRWRESGGAWNPYQPMLNTATFTTNETYEVVQIVSVLQP